MPDSHDAIRRLFRLLSALELNTWPSWDGPIEDASLRSKTKLLAKRFNLVMDEYSDVEFDKIAVALANHLPTEQELRVEGLGQTMRGLLRDGSMPLSKAGDVSVTDQAGLDAHGVMTRWAEHLRANSFCQDSSIPAACWAPEPIETASHLQRLCAVSSRHNHATRGCEDRLSLVTAIAQTSKVCLIVGPPGGGKSSSVRGFMRAILNADVDGYELPVWIDGDEYGKALLVDASRSPLDYFFTQWGPECADLKQAAQAFRDRLSIDKQNLLIIDGWERIPVHVQKLAWSHLVNDARHRKVLLTSRPGSTMFGNQQIQRFELCVPRPEEIRARFQQTFQLQGSHSLADDALEQLRLHDELSSLLVNPYWQSLLATYLLGHGTGKPLTGLTRLAQQLISWEQERTRMQTHSGLTMGHLRVLSELAFSLICNPHSHEVSFTQFDCERAAFRHQVSADEVFASRLVIRCNEVTDEYQFGSEVFQSYLAAQHLVENQSTQQQREFFDLAMTCSRLLPTVLHAVASDDGFRKQTEAWIVDWILRLDHFDVLTQRVAQVVIAAAWDPTDLDGPIPELKSRLWNAIGKSQSEQRIERMMRLLAAIDPDFLQRKMTSLRSSNRVLSIELMKHVPNHLVPSNFAKSAGSTRNPDPANVNALFGFAAKHRVPLDADFVIDALRRHDHERLILVWECLGGTDSHELRQSLDERVDSAVAYQLIHFTSCLQVGRLEQTDIVPLMRAVAKLACVSMNEASVIHLCDALDMTLSKAAEQRNQIPGDVHQLAEDFALAIAARDPAVLLNRFWEHQPVQAALAEFAQQHGWLIYRDRIVNDNGVVIARGGADPLTHLRYSTPDIIQEIAKTLSPRQRNDFLSYWHMVSEGDCDFFQSDRETIHQSMCKILRSELNDSLSERLLSCYQDGEPPQFTTWKKNLNRVVNRCAVRPDWMAHLQKIGLGGQPPASIEATWQLKPR